MTPAIAARRALASRVLGVGLALTLATTTARAQALEDTLVATFDSAWSVLSRTHWDTALVSGRWRATRDSLRPLALKARDEATVRQLIRTLIAVPAQSHFVLMPRSGVATATTGSATASTGSTGRRERTPGSAGLEVRMVGDTIVVWRVARGGPAERAGLMAGAIVSAIGPYGADSIRGLIASSATSPEVARKLINTVATRLIGGDAGDTLQLRVRGEGANGRGAERRLAIVRVPLDGHATKFGNLPTMLVRTRGDSVPLAGRPGRAAALVSFSAWFPVISGELDSLLFAARGAPGVILDLRGNPGGVVAMLAGVSGHFLDSAVALGTMRARGATMRFIANPRRVDRAGTRHDVMAAPLAILVDGFTGSTSEFFASGMQALGRARVFGVPSAGEALPATMSGLPNGDVLMHVIADHEDATGRRVEGRGVRPDELTPLRRADLLAGRDATLQAARTWLSTARR